VIAVQLITVGAFTVIGPVIGVLLAWLSQRWAVREKVIATIAGGFVRLTVLAVGFAWSTTAQVTTPSVVPGPVVSDFVTGAVPPDGATVPSAP
jgi:hypothetical protein